MRIPDRVWISLLVLSYLLSSYYYFDGWWNSSIGSLLIVFFSYLLYKKEFLNIIGLNLPLRTIVKSIILAAGVVGGAWFIMRYLGDRHGIVIQYSHWKNYYHDIFYTLNEEIVLGGILLHVLTYKWKIKPAVASVLLAIFFSMVHFVFYRWIFNGRGLMATPTLLTLFFIGIVRNNVILQTGHIGYSWALHFGWMAVMFGSWHVYVGTDNYLGELARFNTYLGSAEMLGLSGILVLLSFILWSRNQFCCRLA